jgi:hypothetical protein
MAETEEQRAKWLHAAPTPLKDAQQDPHRVQQHQAYSLWRIATVLGGIDDNLKRIADSAEKIEARLDQLGFNREQTLPYIGDDHPPGALEGIGQELRGLREAVEQLDRGE